MSATIKIIGVLSGTSIDAIDCGLFEFSRHKIKFIAGKNYFYNKNTRNKIINLTQGKKISPADFISLDNQIAYEFANAINQFISDLTLDRNQIKAIGSHGQTIWHAPNDKIPITYQMGNGHIICAKTGIVTISDFRRGDVARGGQGAPLAPIFHDAVFRDPEKIKTRIICNIGGISNITVLEAGKPVFGFDTGPGNTLMDNWVRKKYNQNYDLDGKIARSGQVIPKLLEKLLKDPYFSQPPPKSTGPEYFNLNWLGELRGQPQDILASLLELTVISIYKSIKNLKLKDKKPEIYLCGGGAKNIFLFKKLQKLCKNTYLTDKLGFPVDWVEAGLFAFLAKLRLEYRSRGVIFDDIQ